MKRIAFLGNRRWKLDRKRPTILGILGPWVLFHALLVWGWRVQDLFREVPGYGAVEVVWGILWYHRTLVEGRGDPFFTPLIAHPLGWHTTTLAHTPALLLLGLPFYLLGGPAFAFNALCLLPFYLGFAASFRTLREVVGPGAATLGAIVFTFAASRWLRAGAVLTGHLHFVWATSFLPWMLWALIRWEKRKERRWWLLCGLAWGVTLLFSHYSLLLGGLILLGWVYKLGWRRAAVIAITALAVGSPSLILYAIGARADHPVYFELPHIAHWGSSLQILLLPSVHHPWKPLQSLIRHLYGGPLDESSLASLGSITIAIGLLGLLRLHSLRLHSGGVRPLRQPLGLAAGLAFVFSLGPYLKWGAGFVTFFSPIVEIINQYVWEAGHVLKPEIFPRSSPPDPFRIGIPLPALLFFVLVPFTEGMRIISRASIVSTLALASAGAWAWERLPKIHRGWLALLWLVEILPTPTAHLPFPPALHPAYEWLASQPMSPEEGILDLQYPGPLMDSGILMATWLHGKPTAANAGSFRPLHTQYLVRFLASRGVEALARPNGVRALQAFRVRYVFFHRTGEFPQEEEQWWEALRNNPALRVIGCFEPPTQPSLWTYPICVVEVPPVGASVPLLYESGWSGWEQWGIWAEGIRSRLIWFTRQRKRYRLELEAFPYCLAGRPQHLWIRLNGSSLGEIRWETCEAQKISIPIPPSRTREGINELVFEYAYAARPVEISGGRNPDPRPLSVGFARLELLDEDAR